MDVYKHPISDQADDREVLHGRLRKTGLEPPATRTRTPRR